MSPVDEAPTGESGKRAADRAYALSGGTPRAEVDPLCLETFEKVEQAKREWESTADSLSQLICLIDPQGRLIRANRTVESWGLGRVVEVRGRGLHALLHPGCLDSACSLSTFLKQALALNLQGQASEWESDDPILARYVRVQARPVHDRHRATTQTCVVVVEDVTERKRTEETLRQTALELHTRNEELHAFAHTVAHDLKNPLSNLRLHIDLLKEHRAGMPGEIQRGQIDDMAEIAQKMVNIIDELLLLAEVRQADVHVAPLDMAHIVNGARRRVADLVGRYQAEIDMPAEWPVALGYAPWIEQVWVNYLSNALKYGGRPPHLKLGASGPADGRARFWVRDDGPGIPLDQQRRLFTPFTRLDQARTTGHGLGLSIVQRIVEKLNGTVSVESDGVPGRGCVFSFTLPAQDTP